MRCQHQRHRPTTIPLLLLPPPPPLYPATVTSATVASTATAATAAATATNVAIAAAATNVAAAAAATADVAAAASPATHVTATNATTTNIQRRRCRPLPPLQPLPLPLPLPLLRCSCVQPMPLPPLPMPPPLTGRLLLLTSLWPLGERGTSTQPVILFLREIPRRFAVPDKDEGVLLGRLEGGEPGPGGEGVWCACICS